MEMAEQMQALETAKLALAAGDFDKAKIEFDHVLRQDPDNFAAMNGMGKVCAAQSEYVAALAQYQKVVKLAPDDPDGYFKIKPQPEDQTQAVLQN